MPDSDLQIGSQVIKMVGPTKTAQEGYERVRQSYDVRSFLTEQYLLAELHPIKTISYIRLLSYQNIVDFFLALKILKQYCRLNVMKKCDFDKDEKLCIKQASI